MLYKQTMITENPESDGITIAQAKDSMHIKLHAHEMFIKIHRFA